MSQFDCLGLCWGCGVILAVRFYVTIDWGYHSSPNLEPGPKGQKELQAKQGDTVKCCEQKPKSMGICTCVKRRFEKLYFIT